MRSDTSIVSMRVITTAVLVIAGIACATSSSIVGDTSPQEDTYALDGVYEFEAEVDAREVGNSPNEPPVRIVVRGAVTFVRGEFVMLENDYSNPCGIREFARTGSTRIVVECPNFRLEFLRGRSPSSRETRMWVRVDVGWWKAHVQIRKQLP